MDAMSENWMTLQQAGRHQEVVTLLAKAVTANPGDPSLWYHYGLSLIHTGPPEMAVQAFDTVLKYHPNSAQALFQKAELLKQGGAFIEARRLYEDALKFNPDFIPCLINMGLVQVALKQFPQAMATYDRALAKQPDSFPACFNRAALCFKLKKYSEALIGYEKSLAIQPHYFSAEVSRVLTLWELGRTQEAQQACGLLLAQPTSIGFDRQMRLGQCLVTLKQFDAAERLAESCLAERQDSAEANLLLGTILINRLRLEAAIPLLEKALKIDPDLTTAYHQLGFLYYRQGRMAAAIQALGQVVRTSSNTPNLHSDFVTCHLYSAEMQPARLLEVAREWNRCHGQSRSKAVQPLRNDSDPDRPLRIGYVSSDFRRHSVSYFITPLLEAHNRDDFQIFCYSNVKEPDETTRYIRGITDVWLDIVVMNDLEVADRVRQDQIDILVDLSGHSKGNRLPVFVQQPAPVQITWMGHPGSTGLDGMAWRFTDQLSDPAGESDQYYSERNYRLPLGLLCFKPLESTPDVASLPVRRNGFITFASFNNLAKVNPPLINLWISLLKRVIDSRLLLKDQGFHCVETRERLQAVFSQAGIGPERLILKPYTNSLTEHLALYNTVDIGLDTFPYNGTTTTCEAFWMGVPVVSLAGRTQVSRMGVTLLDQVGYGHLAQSNPANWLEQAVALASDWDALEDIRNNLRQRLQHSTLGSPKKYAAQVETAYRDLWRQWLESR
jgi:protein O-GlcNAc transferase